MKRKRAVSLALVGLFVWTTGCTSYKQIELGEVADYGKVRVTRTDGARETLYDPEIVTDSIRAHEKPEYERDYYDPIVVVPMNQVGELEAVGSSAKALIGIGVLVGTFALLSFALYGDDDTGY